MTLKKRFISVKSQKKQGDYCESQSSAEWKNRGQASFEGTHSSATVKLADE